MGIENLITIGAATLKNVQQYNWQDSGLKAERKEFVGDNAIYIFNRGRSAFKTCSISGNCTVADRDSLEAIYEAGTTVSMTDMLGETFTSTLITSFSSSYIRSTGACQVSINVLVPADSNKYFVVGGAKTYGIESFSVVDRGNRGQAIDGVTGTVGFVARTYTADLKDISISGIEFTAKSFSSTYGTGKIVITAPDGVQYTMIVTEKSWDQIEGTNGFIKFNIRGIASTNASKKLVSENGESALVEAFSIVDNSARVSVQRCLSAKVVQQFTNIADYEYDLTYIIGKTNTDNWTVGAEVTITIGSDNYTGVVTSKRKTIPNESDLIYRNNITLTSST